MLYDRMKVLQFLPDGHYTILELIIHLLEIISSLCILLLLV